MVAKVDPAVLLLLCLTPVAEIGYPIPLYYATTGLPKSLPVGFLLTPPTLQPVERRVDVRGIKNLVAILERRSLNICCSFLASLTVRSQH
jgi:hypothetical protein